MIIAEKVVLGAVGLGVWGGGWEEGTACAKAWGGKVLQRGP